MYDYPLDYTWSTEEIIDVMSLYNAVEKAYEEGISKEEFMNCYRLFTSIVDSKSQQKQLDKESALKNNTKCEFEKVLYQKCLDELEKCKENKLLSVVSGVDNVKEIIKES